MRHPRNLLPTDLYFVTIRTVDAQFALHPYSCPGAWRRVLPGVALDPEERHAMNIEGEECVRRTEQLTEQVAAAEQGLAKLPVITIDYFTNSVPNILGSRLAQGVDRYGIELHAFVYMSNHVHLVVQAPRGNLDEFMAYVNGQSARDLNRFLDRAHQFWARRYSAAPILDSGAELERLLYTLMNPQNASLVCSPQEWPGLSSAPFLFEGRTQRFLCFDRARWHRNDRPKDIGPYLSTMELRHALLPHLWDVSVHNRAALLHELIHQQKVMKQLDTTSEPRAPLAPSKLLEVVPTDRPKNPKRSPQPLCHTTSLELYKVFARKRREYNHVCREVSKAYMQGEVGREFPAGAYAPAKFPKARYPDAPERSNLPYLASSHIRAIAAERAFTTAA